jgi:autotransporter-associated beta strand protein
MHRPIDHSARARAVAFLLPLLLLVTAPLVHAAQWTNPGAPTDTVSWGFSNSSITISANVSVGEFLFDPSYNGYLFTVNAGTLIFTTGGVVNNSTSAPTFRVVNGGDLYFTGTGTSLGDARYVITTGTLRMRTDHNVDGSLALFNLGGAGTLRANNPLDGGTMTLGAVVGNGGAIDFGTAPLTVGSLEIDTSFNGTIIGNATVGTALTKVGTGTWTISGASTYVGNTLISAGTIKIANTSGSVFGTGDVTIAHGATLTGAGAFTGALLNSGTFSPGNSPTLMTLSAFNQDVNGALILELGGLARGTGYDALDITGAAAFDGTLTISLINGFNPATGASFNLFDWGSQTGTFATLNLPGLASGLSWDTSLLYTDGVLSVTGTATAIPEPSIYAALLGAAALGLAIRRRHTAKTANAPPAQAA